MRITINKSPTPNAMPFYFIKTAMTNLSNSSSNFYFYFVILLLLRSNPFFRMDTWQVAGDCFF